MFSDKTDVTCRLLYCCCIFCAVFSVSQMQVLHVMSFIIERMQWEVRPYAGALIAYLPSLWEESAEHNLLRCAILTTLTNLVWVRTVMYV